jgi:hypothetical protein
MHLYKVSGHHIRNELVGLLPGSPFDYDGNIDPRIGQLRQGSPIQLRLPSGRVIKTEIADYYIRVRQEGSKILVDDPPRIVIAVPHGFAPNDIPIGTDIEF